mgnify:CR=1 FL=1
MATVGRAHVSAERLQRLRAQLIRRALATALDLAHLLDGNAFDEPFVQTLDERYGERPLPVVLDAYQYLAGIRYQQLDAVGGSRACTHTRLSLTASSSAFSRRTARTTSSAARFNSK